MLLYKQNDERNIEEMNTKIFVNNKRFPLFENNKKNRILTVRYIHDNSSTKSQHVQKYLFQNKESITVDYTLLIFVQKKVPYISLTYPYKSPTQKDPYVSIIRKKEKYRFDTVYQGFDLIGFIHRMFSYKMFHT